MNICLGRLLNKIPYKLVPKIGAIYCDAQQEISKYDKDNLQQEYVFHKIYSIVEYAINNIKFYRDFYAAKGFALEQLKTFYDIPKIPVITKHDLMKVPLEDRSIETGDNILVNTGGSTGVPLTFYKLKKSRIKEMAYYHYAWKNIGYDKSMVRLQFVGRQDEKGLIYEFARNQLRVSIYEPFDILLQQLSIINKRELVGFLQGYPSVIYEFAIFCIQHPDEYEQSHLSKSLKGIFLNSEYPQPLYRKKIEAVFKVRTVASFGHTEGLCLGFDYGERYQVMQSYGYSEAVEMEDGIHLVGTTYDNIASPLIRYDTNDIMDEVKIDNGILKSFTMTSGGRNGQYVVDANGKHISLTGLIFGKHHALFNYCSQLQISQKAKGKATIYYVPMDDLPIGFDPASLFDSRGIDIVFEFKQIAEPIKTKAGKVMLKINE